MSPLRLTASQLIERHQGGMAAIVKGQRVVAARLANTGQPTQLDAEVDDPDVQCTLIDGRLDAEDLARVMTGFRGQPLAWTPRTGGVRPTTAGVTSVYAVDPESGMVYLLD